MWFKNRAQAKEMSDGHLGIGGNPRYSPAWVELIDDWTAMVLLIKSLVWNDPCAFQSSSSMPGSSNWNRFPMTLCFFASLSFFLRLCNGFDGCDHCWSNQLVHSAWSRTLSKKHQKAIRPGHWPKFVGVCRIRSYERVRICSLSKLFEDGATVFTEKAVWGCCHTTATPSLQSFRYDARLAAWGRVMICSWPQRQSVV